ncbi:hypothetical protein ACFYNO_03680 [Kitasatospora sp. NPDC006697]|uniref:SMODS-associated NUDIX domain-containing protein n=1 Tax=Kitasatospora sp. NPDC006697 TaxID=3364020 RepID=UPI00367D8CC7
MKKLAFYSLALVACLLAAFLLRGSTWGDLATGGVATLLLPLFDSLLSSRLRIRHRWYSLRYATSDIRVSAAYLFRIKVDDRYLLIRSNRAPHFQPVGGVYKASRDGKAFLAAIGARDDDLIPIDTESASDLRIRIKGSQLPRFYDWFDARKGREDSPWREFHEELIEPGILSPADFPYVFHDYLGREVDRIRHSRHADSLEILIADVYDLLPTARQEAALRTLLASHGPTVAWATADTIRRRGAVPGGQQTIDIAQHAIRVI